MAPEQTHGGINRLRLLGSGKHQRNAKVYLRLKASASMLDSVRRALTLFRRPCITARCSARRERTQESVCLKLPEPGASKAEANNGETARGGRPYRCCRSRPRRRSPPRSPAARSRWWPGPAGRPDAALSADAWSARSLWLRPAAGGRNTPVKKSFKETEKGSGLSHNR